MPAKKKQEGRETYYSMLTGRHNYRYTGHGHQYTKQFRLSRDEIRANYVRVKGGKNPYNYRLVGEFYVTVLNFDNNEGRMLFMDRSSKELQQFEFWGFHDGHWSMPACLVGKLLEWL